MKLTSAEAAKVLRKMNDDYEALLSREQASEVFVAAINVFNATTEVPGFGMTIDAMLVYIPQLTRCRNRLAQMKSRLPKERVEAGFRAASNIIDYRYANYDIEAAQAAYDEVSDRLAKAQTTLDLVNSTATFEYSE